MSRLPWYAEGAGKAGPPQRDRGPGCVREVKFALCSRRLDESGNICCHARHVAPLISSQDTNYEHKGHSRSVMQREPPPAKHPQIRSITVPLAEVLNGSTGFELTRDWPVGDAPKPMIQRFDRVTKELEDDSGDFRGPHRQRSALRVLCATPPLPARNIPMPAHRSKPPPHGIAIINS
jgi:hypothetical protein